MFRLIIDTQPDNPVLLPPDLAIVIGRGGSCDVQLMDASASRMHCRVIATKGRVTLHDAGSRWGTFVNGMRITECDLKPGDRILIGETTLQLVLDKDPNHSTLARPSELVRPAGLTAWNAHDENGADDSMAAFQSSVEMADGVNIGFAPSSLPPVADLRMVPGDFIGTTFHRYSVLRLLAETPNGMVFHSESLADKSPVALKVFKPTFFKSDADEQRFTRAVKTMFGKRHPNIVELLNAGRWNGWFFTASEYIEGISAVDLIRKIGILGMMPTDKVLQIAVDLCQSLRFAKDCGIVHRNIRPSNILLRQSDGTALLNDLILARSIELSGSERLTNPGDILGDVGYMSPEQLGSGYPLDHRSDIYQLGATLYHLLTGRPPLEGGTLAATITMILTGTPESVRARNMAIPASFESVIMKMIEHNPRNRYPSAKQLETAIQMVLNETQQHRVRAVDVNPRATGWKGALEDLF
ncbi:MAG: protein kinase [Planctomycetota bacterium]|nr:protein kinase [Planctomycetota bacterium]